MDPVTIATGVVAFLSPFLVEGGKAMAKKAGEALVAALERRFKDRPAAQEALGDVKQEPRNEDFQAVLRVQLQKALAADGEFLAEVARLLKEAQAEAPDAGYRAELRGSGAIAQGPGAVAAGAGGVAVGGSLRDSTVITGDGNVIGNGSRSHVQVGGIHAERIEAENVVDGVQMQGAAVEDAARLVKLARAIERGGITADQIRAGSVVSGLQFLAGAPPAGQDDLRREIAALREQVQQAIAAGEMGKAGDAEDVQDALKGAEAELAKPQPDGERVVRKLETAAKILTGTADLAQAAGKVGLHVLRLAPLAAALWKLAEKILGG